MAKDVLHVVPHEQVWAVRREGNERVSSTHPTQKDAIDAARELAKERDDIVVHRPDGTIRERVTYFGGNGHSAAETTAAPADREAALQDLVGVKSRVSWEAVFAGAVVALATYFTLALLAAAVGLSVMDRVSDRAFNTTAGVVAGVILLVSLFLGGYIASHLTAGERPGEGAGYGVLVWGAMVLILMAGLAVGLPGPLAAARLGPAADTAVSADRVKQELALNDQQAERYAALTREARGLASNVNATTAAWWAFGSVALSLLSAMAGGWLGTGPQLVLRSREAGRVAVVEPRPA